MVWYEGRVQGRRGRGQLREGGRVKQQLKERGKLKQQVRKG